MMWKRATFNRCRGRKRLARLVFPPIHNKRRAGDGESFQKRDHHYQRKGLRRGMPSPTDSPGQSGGGVRWGGVGRAPQETTGSANDGRVGSGARNSCKAMMTKGSYKLKEVHSSACGSSQWASIGGGPREAPQERRGRSPVDRNRLEDIRYWLENIR